MNGRGTSYRAGWSDWRADAACLDVDTELFFPLGRNAEAVMQAEDAKAVCARCPVREQCLQRAMDTPEKHGIFGGLDETERERLRRREKNRAYKAASRARGSR